MGPSSQILQKFAGHKESGNAKPFGCHAGGVVVYVGCALADIQVPADAGQIQAGHQNTGKGRQSNQHMVNCAGDSRRKPAGKRQAAQGEILFKIIFQGHHTQQTKQGQHQRKGQFQLGEVSHKTSAPEEKSIWERNPAAFPAGLHQICRHIRGETAQLSPIPQALVVKEDEQQAGISHCQNPEKCLKMNGVFSLFTERRCQWQRTLLQAKPQKGHILSVVFGQPGSLDRTIPYSYLL